jgi:hypothetical protein
MSLKNKRFKVKKMKKIGKYIPIAFLFIAMIFNSCSSDENVENISSANNLISKTAEYNKKFKFEDPNNQKGFLSSFTYGAGLFVGDITGAAAAGASVAWIATAFGAATAGTGFLVIEGIAGIVGAVGGSYMAHCTMRGCSKSSQTEYQIFNFPDRYDIEVNFIGYERYAFIGDMHNSNLVLNKFGNTSNVDFFEHAISNEIGFFKGMNTEDNKQLSNDLLSSTEFTKN